MFNTLPAPLPTNKKNLILWSVRHLFKRNFSFTCISVRYLVLMNLNFGGWIRRGVVTEHELKVQFFLRFVHFGIYYKQIWHGFQGWYSISRFFFRKKPKSLQSPRFLNVYFFVFIFVRFFFSAKKNTTCFFSFPRKSSFAIHSKSGGVSIILLKSKLCFFFSAFLGVFSVFFFPGKVHMFIHSFDLKAVFFFRHWKKKNSFFIHSIDFCQKCVKY